MIIMSDDNPANEVWMLAINQLIRSKVEAIRCPSFIVFLQLIHLWEGQRAIHHEAGWHWLMHFSCSSSRRRPGMQFVCHECHRALWTRVEDCKNGSPGTSSHSRALLPKEGQGLLLTLRGSVKLSCGSQEKTVPVAQRLTTQYVNVKRRNSPLIIQLSNSTIQIRRTQN